MNDKMKRLSAAVLAVGLLLGSAACSSDEKADTTPVEGEGAAASSESPSAGAEEPGDQPAGDVSFDEALDAMGPEGLASAMVTAMGAERYEMVGDVVHLYLSPDGSMNNAMMACMVADSVVNEGDVVVMHDADGETTC